MKNVMKKDLVIIGGGPAGLTASLYASAITSGLPSRWNRRRWAVR